MQAYYQDTTNELGEYAVQLWIKSNNSETWTRQGYTYKTKSQARRYFKQHKKLINIVRKIKF